MNLESCRCEFSIYPPIPYPFHPLRVLIFGIHISLINEYVLSISANFEETRKHHTYNENFKQHERMKLKTNPQHISKDSENYAIMGLMGATTTFATQLLYFE